MAPPALTAVKKDVPLEIEHLTPALTGGSNRVTNLTLACQPCNQKKGNRTAVNSGHPKLASQSQSAIEGRGGSQCDPLCYGDVIRAIGLPTAFWSGGRTKHNRVAKDYPKDHWIDAACVGESGAAVVLNGVTPLVIKATGRATPSRNGLTVTVSRVARLDG